MPGQTGLFMAFFSVGKVAWMRSWHALPSSVEVTNDWSYNSILPTRLRGEDSDNIIFFVTSNLKLLVSSEYHTSVRLFPVLEIIGTVLGRVMAIPGLPNLLRLIHTYHVVSMSRPCRGAKGLDCAFPIWFTQCGRVWFTHAMPRPCHATACVN
jgi:hypothetical protein